MSRRTHLVAQTAQQPKVEADRLLQQGIQQTQSDQFETAIQSLQQALQLYQELKDLQAEATTLMSLGNAHEALARYDPAMAYYDQARQIYQKLNDLNGVSDALMALGTTSESLSQYEKAIKYHEQSLALARKVKNRFNEGRSLGNLGTAYLGLGDYETTIKYHKQSLAIKQETNDRLGEGRILSDMGTAYLALGDTQTAISLYHDSLRIAWEVDDRRGEAIALRNLGKAYEALGRYDKAVESHKESLAIAQEIGDRRGEGESLINLGVAYRGRGNYAQAIEYHEQSLAITREIGDRRGEGSALGNLGMNYYAQGNYTKAIEYHTQRLAIALEIKDRQGEGNAMGNLGNAYRNQGNYAKAIEYHEKRLAITREIKEIRGEGQSLGYLGLVYRTLGNYEKSIEYYQQSLEISIKIKDRLTEAKSLGYLGNAYYDLGYYTEAIKYHQMSLEVAKAINDRRGQGKSLGYLGNAYDAQGQYDEAIKYYTLSLEIAREVNDLRGEGKTLSSLGSAYHELGDYDKAIEYHKSGLEIARKINNRDGERIALSNLGLTLQKQNQPDLSIVFYKQSVNVSESLRQEIKKLPRQVQEIYTSSVAGTYRNLADLLLSQGRIREAQSILELLKVQEVQSYGDEILDSAAIQLPFHPLEANALKGFEAVLSANTFSPITLAGIGQPLRQNRDRILQDSNNTSTQIGNPEPIFKANPNALLIQNLVVGDKLWVLWTAANGKTTAVEVPNVTQARLTLTVQKFRDQIGSPFSDLDVLKDTSNQIYNWLLPAQLQAELAKNPRQALIFSLDHVTRYVPIAALFDGNQYLTQRYTVSNLITTDSDMGDRLSQNGQVPTVLALGTSKAFPNFTPLPNVPAELNAIVQEGDNQGIYPGKIRLNEAFTANILRANLDAYRILHIATHGSFNPKSITDSFLLLGDGNRLPITEISRLTQLTTTHLVVLSACETGLSGSAQDGTEISGISGYFLYRGAKSVLASLWAVNDASTSLLMQQFYRNLATNTAQHPITKAEALRQAQLALLQGKITAKDAPNRSDIAIDVKPGTRLAQERSDFSHPYYWAPFVLIGNSL
ncbi:MAG TPA: tetratricopeptide repeat protein [Leptolyngbyaceae cyanobacterium M33_DOE_097]|nr:tetratricopeptide repeat protein [Leptolyngbyaceae cyanobacterium M33_DOE_097]